MSKSSVFANMANEGVATTSLIDDAVTLAKMAPAADGSLITYDAAQDPELVTPGTTGQVLTSRGNASTPTFQDAAGDFVYIDTQTTSSTTIIKHAMSTDYRAFRLYYEDLVPTVNAAEINLDFYDSNMSTSGMETLGGTVVSCFHETPHWHVAQSYTNEWGFKSFLSAQIAFNVSNRSDGAGGASGFMDIQWGLPMFRAGTGSTSYAHSVSVKGCGWHYNDGNDYRYRQDYHIFACCAAQVYGLGIWLSDSATFRDGARTTLYGLKPGI